MVGGGEATARRPTTTTPGQTESGQRVGRGRAPPPLDNGASHRATMRRQLVCLASVGRRDCAPALAAHTRVGRPPHGARHQLGRGASIVIARGPWPRATRQQRPLRPQAPRRRLPRPRGKRGRHRPRPLSWPLRTEWPAPLARSARHAVAMRYTMKPSRLLARRSRTRPRELCRGRSCRANWASAGAAWRAAGGAPPDAQLEQRRVYINTRSGLSGADSRRRTCVRSSTMPLPSNTSAACRASRRSCEQKKTSMR